ncbi:MAG: hypothetical protein IIX67_04615 [Clostridia bacterium]|nr:hypothetical protein [Clostridia bacterium]
MKTAKKALLLILSAVLAALVLTSCGGSETPYDKNNEENYTVSVKYDANGGFFTTNTSVIVDSYNVNDIPKNANGNVDIALLAPDASERGNDAFKAVKNGYFLAGWYTDRIEQTDASGNKSYTYSGKWDFASNTLEIDPNRNYSANNSLITLYAAWVPLFKIEFYDLTSNELIETFTYDPTSSESIKVPKWNEKSGAIDMFDFPEKSGYTFKTAYYDVNKEKELVGETVEHCGKVDLATGTAVDPTLKLYVDWTEGEWYKISTAEQFIKNFSANGCYEILDDLDFKGKIWPTASMYGNFSGRINGNGHVFKNIEVTQTQNSKVNAGLFGQLTEDAEISDLTLENICFTIKAGTRVPANYGLLAGTVSANATVENVKIVGGVLQIDSGCYFGVDDYSIGLVCGSGNDQCIENADISCSVVGENPDRITVAVDGNKVTLEFNE